MPAQVITAVLSMLVAGGALLMGVLATRRSDKVVKAQLRAYVQAVDARIEWAFEDAGKPPTIALLHMRFKNTGQTPAHAVRAGREAKLIGPDTFGQPIEFGIAVAPDQPASDVGSDLIFSTKAKEYPVSELIAALQKGSRPVIYGQVTYLDAFGARRFTEACLALETIQIPRSKGDEVVIAFGLYPHHNSST